MLVGSLYVHRFRKKLEPVASHNTSKMKQICLLSLGIVFSTLVFGQVNHPFTPIFTVSDNPPQDIPANQAYTFGYLEVPENRRNPISYTIKIPVYIFKSRSENPQPDPIIYTVGGPGETTMPSAQYMKYYQYLDDRDVILVEQRGNYYAKPHLACPTWAQAVYESKLPGVDSQYADSLLKAAAEACKDRLIIKGVDLNGYNTHEIAADIADLVATLGIKRYNLLTVSYSTKIAQVLMRDYPAGIRSVVMDSPLPLEVSYDEESVGNLLASLELLCADCEADPSCRAAFPNLQTRFLDYLAEKNRDPLVVKVKNPHTRQTETFYLSGTDLIAVFTGASTSEVADIPYEMDQLMQGNLRSVKKQLATLFQSPGDGAGIGMRLSVWCAEEYPFADQQVIRAETHRYPALAGLSPAVFDSSICDIWGVKPVSAKENQPIQSNMPVLLISGEYDHDTPPTWAAQMHQRLPKSHHLIFKGWKHTPTTNWGNPCAMEAAHAFFNQPDRLPQPDCFGAIGRPLFKTK